jgi:hypothetical protein
MLITITGGKPPFSICSTVAVSRFKLDHILAQLVFIHVVEFFECDDSF